MRFRQRFSVVCHSVADSQFWPVRWRSPRQTNLPLIAFVGSQLLLPDSLSNILLRPPVPEEWPSHLRRSRYVLLPASYQEHENQVYNLQELGSREAIDR